jgi:hypothetical protein
MPSANNFLHLKPAVPKCWLFFTSGVMWSAVGIMLCTMGVRWLTRAGIMRAGVLELTGLLLAVLIARLGFGPIAQKNIRRLRHLPARGCFFAFQAWKSYVIIVVMIALGVTLRHSSIPKTYLAAVYTGIGGALFLASFHYYRVLRRLWRIASRRGNGFPDLP